MGNLLVSFLLPPLLVFGLYHLLTWTDLFHVNGMTLWRRVALASAITHVTLASGFFVFLYFQFTTSPAPNFGVFLFERSEFRWVLTVFDTGAMLALLAFFSALDRLGVSPPGIVAWTVGITLVAGSVQWYFLGGAVGALLERIWAGLKTEDDDEEWFQ